MIEYWRTLTTDKDLFGIVLDNFLQALYNTAPYDNAGDSKDDKMLKTLTHMPFAIICAIKEFFSVEKNESIGVSVFSVCSEFFLNKILKIFSRK